MPDSRVLTSFDMFGQNSRFCTVDLTFPDLSQFVPLERLRRLAFHLEPTGLSHRTTNATVQIPLVLPVSRVCHLLLSKKLSLPMYCSSREQYMGVIGGLVPVRGENAVDHACDEVRIHAFHDGSAESTRIAS